MTDKPSDAAVAKTPTATDTPADTGPTSSNKNFWMGVGIGSAAVVAALMYARRPKKKK